MDCNACYPYTARVMSVLDLITELRHEPRRALVRHTDDELTEARSSLRYWEQRRRRLPWHRRAQRREALEMADRWRDRVRVAEHQRLGRGTLGHLAVLAGSSAARTVVRRATIALAIVGLVLIAAVATVVALWPQIAALV